MSIPIPALEFIAAITALFTFATTLPKLSIDTHLIHLRVDALATPFVLTDDAASSPLLVALHTHVLAQAWYQGIADLLVCSHVYGVGNEFSDAASRGQYQRLSALAAQFRVTPTELPTHSICEELLNIALPFT